MQEKKSPKTKKAHKSWLQYVTEQSWEPELLISGLAIYATLQMPALFQKAYQYYQYDLQVGTGLLDRMLPILIYCVFTAAAYILIVAFISHFAVRAFWIGFVGLLSVYEDEIDFENLNYSDHFKEGIRRDLGSCFDMAVRLDQISSLIFSVGFIIVMMMIAIAVWYFVIFILYNVLKLFLSPSVFNTYLTVLGFTPGVLLVLYYAGSIIRDDESIYSLSKKAG